MKYATVLQSTGNGITFYCQFTKLQKQIFTCQLLIINEQYYSQHGFLYFYKWKSMLTGGANNQAGKCHWRGRCYRRWALWFSNHSALFGLYSLMDAKTRNILTTHVLKVRKEASHFIKQMMPWQPQTERCEG